MAIEQTHDPTYKRILRLTRDQRGWLFWYLVTILERQDAATLEDAITKAEQHTEDD